MKIYCKYNEEYDRFLKRLVEYVLQKYGSELDITGVKEIELVKEIKGFGRH